MKQNLNALQIAEWQSFSAKDIESVCGDEKKAAKYFGELADFAKGKDNNNFLNFYGRDRLKARNFVGLIQTKSGFCVEILPKVFKEQDSTHKDCKLKPQIPHDEIKAFANRIKSLESSDNSKGKSQNQSTKGDLCKVCQAKQILLNCLATLKNSPFKQSSISSLKTLQAPLLEIFVKMFLDELDKLVHRGIRSDYVAIEQNRNFLKGKLLFTQNIAQNLVHKERFYTQSDEFIADIAPNRLIKSTLLLLSKLHFSPRTSTKINQMRFIFDEIRISSNVDSDFAKCSTSRHFRHYTLLLAWCKIFLKRQIFTPYSGVESAFALLFDMNKLFESFVATHLRRHCENLKIQPSSKYLIQSEAENIKTSLFTLKPDMIAEVGDAILILDTKWKVVDSKDDKCGISQGDLYQMWAYASKYALEKTKQNKPKEVKVFLIYPDCDTTKNLRDEWQNKEWTFKAPLPRMQLDKCYVNIRFFPLISNQDSTDSKLESQDSTESARI